jgi:hypothetical protein
MLYEASTSRDRSDVALAAAVFPISMRLFEAGLSTFRSDDYLIIGRFAKREICRET